MIIGGLQKISLLDFPGKVSAILFTQGCNFRCHFCYNPMLVWPNQAGCLNTDLPNGDKKSYSINEDDFFYFLKSRQGKLDGLVITGGEPTLHRDLPDFIYKIKKMGFLVKLDTNGTNPGMLSELIEKKLIDYIAMDIKASREKYNEITGVKVQFKNIEKSVKIIMDYKGPYEFRTTIMPGMFELGDIQEIGRLIEGAELWYLQKFLVKTELVDNSLVNETPYTEEETLLLVGEGRKHVKKCELR